ncbi:hypothetical protein EE612_029049, partial [Oryza sativa]
LERWFSEMDVGWVLLRSALDREGVERLDDLVRRWMRGFTVMAHAISATHHHLHDERPSPSPRCLPLPTPSPP